MFKKLWNRCFSCSSASAEPLGPDETCKAPRHADAKKIAPRSVYFRPESDKENMEKYSFMPVI